MGDKPDVSEVLNFDKTKLKKQEVNEKSALPTSGGKISICDLVCDFYCGFCLMFSSMYLMCVFACRYCT